jgi:large subunit ribosomal protein L25
MAVAEALKVELRESRGKQAAKQMRREGRIPGVVYAADRESIPVSVSAYDFASITRHHGLSALVKLEGLPDGETIAVYKQLQLHPVRYETQHIDFQAVPAGSKVAMKVRIATEGLPIGVDQEGGVLVKAHDTITVRALPQDLPELLTVNIAHLHRGDALHAHEVSLPEGVELVSEGRVTLASVSGTRASLAAAKAEEAAGNAEGEGEAPAEGEAKAEG